MKTTAIVLAAGAGHRMNSTVQKQFLILKEKPILYYSLKAFEDSNIDEVILVTDEDHINYCRNEIVNQYHLSKVKAVTAGGLERYHSVYNGISSIRDTDYVLIHDGARPLITSIIINRIIENVQIHEACIAAMPVKDTIKIADKDRNVIHTPNRNVTWQIQTPQAFSYELIKTSYESLLKDESQEVTDDAMVIEKYSKVPIKLIESSYTNIKITTPEDLVLANALIERNKSIKT